MTASLPQNKTTRTHPDRLTATTKPSSAPVPAEASSPVNLAMSASRTSSQCSSPASPTSPIEHYFETIAERMGRGRSRSRTRNDVGSSNRSKSPSKALPPVDISTPVSSPSSPKHSSSRHFPTSFQSISTSSSKRPDTLKHQKRSSTGTISRTTSGSGSDPWRGRHSNSWLFNDFSVTDTVKDLYRRRKDS